MQFWYDIRDDMAERYPNFDRAKWDQFLWEMVTEDSTPTERIEAVCRVQELAFDEMLRISDELRAKLLRERPLSFQIIKLD